MRICFSCPVQGEAFRPTEAEEQSGIRFSEKNEIGDVGKSGRYRGKPQPYGFGSLETEITDSDLEVPLKRFLEQVQQGLPVWRSLGADSIHLQIDVFYEHQCNLELSESLISALHALRLSVALSCYHEEKAESSVADAC